MVAYALACFLFRTCAFLDLCLSSSHPLDLIRGQITTWYATGQPEVFWTLTACSADDYWQGTHGKSMNNGCETVVRGTKLMMYIFWGIIKCRFLVSLSQIQKLFLKCSKNVLSVAHALHLFFTRYLSITHIVMSVNWPLVALYMSGNLAVIVRFMCSMHRWLEPQAAAGTSLSSPDNFLPQFFYLFDVLLRYPARCDRCFSNKLSSFIFMAQAAALLPK